MAITIDDSRYPIVLVTFEGSTDDATFQRYLEDVERLVLARQQRSVTIIDARHAESTPASQRRLQAEWIKHNADKLKHHSAGTVFVISSRLVRGMLTAILWLQPLPGEHAVVGSMEEAESWARARLG